MLAVLALLAAGLSACSPAASGSAAGGRADGAPSAATGARLYNDNCTACHQEDGHGIPGVYPNLADSPVVLGDPVALARWVVHGERPASLPAGRYPTLMPQFSWMTPDEAAAILTYMRSSFGNRGPAVSAAELRAALAER